MPQPIVVIAAAARMAPQILDQALAEGRRVTAVVRDPSKIVPRPGLTVVSGDIYDVDSLTAAMAGDEAVISVIGPKIDLAVECTCVDVYSVGAALLITAMRRKGMRRLIVMSSGGVEIIPETKPDGVDPILAWVWKERGLYQDMQRMEKIVHGSDLDVTVMRPRTFVEGPMRNDLKTSVGTPTPNVASTLTYADLARFILDEVDNGRFVGKTVGVYTDTIAFPHAAN